MWKELKSSAGWKCWEILLVINHLSFPSAFILSLPWHFYEKPCSLDSWISTLKPTCYRSLSLRMYLTFWEKSPARGESTVYGLHSLQENPSPPINKLRWVIPERVQLLQTSSLTHFPGWKMRLGLVRSTLKAYNLALEKCASTTRMSFSFLFFIFTKGAYPAVLKG